MPTLSTFESRGYTFGLPIGIGSAKSVVDPATDHRDIGVQFTGESVRAMLKRRKNQTRRIVHGRDLPFVTNLLANYVAGEWNGRPRAYGKSGDVLWGRESGWLLEDHDAFVYDATPEIIVTLDGNTGQRDLVMLTREEVEIWTPEKYAKKGWKRSIAQFMPRWAARITAEIVDTRPERLQDITEADAIAEGMEPNWRGDPGEFIPEEHGWLPPEWTNWKYGLGESEYDRLTAVDAYQMYWDSIHRKHVGRSWNDNPMVWRIEYREPFKSWK